MEPLDYKLLFALDAVIRAQNFERAAKSIGLTQSAVSQRVKQLEQSMGQPLLIRSQPLRATPAGESLLAHFHRVRNLEQETLGAMRTDHAGVPFQLGVAVNADSLATWFVPAVGSILADGHITLHFHVCHEDTTLEKMRAGEASAAVSSHPQPLPGCLAYALGSMRYRLVASPAFRARFFADGLTLPALREAPCVDFDARDSMHADFLSAEFGLPPGSYPCHTVSSSQAFVALALADAAYCLIPEMQIADELQAGHLVDLRPGVGHDGNLYWHHWAFEAGPSRSLSEVVRDQAPRWLANIDRG